MNQLEERLGIVQRQIKVLNKKMEETTDLNEQYRISREIQDLNVEEYELLKQLEVLKWRFLLMIVRNKNGKPKQ